MTSFLGRHRKKQRRLPALRVVQTARPRQSAVNARGKILTAFLLRTHGANDAVLLNRWQGALRVGGVSTSDMAARLVVSPNTLLGMERGDSAVVSGAPVTAAFAPGLLDRPANFAGPAIDASIHFRLPSGDTGWHDSIFRTANEIRRPTFNRAKRARSNCVA